MASVIHATGHGLSTDDPVRFINLEPLETGIDESATYYVLDASDPNAFTFSDTVGGTPFVLTLAITDGTLVSGAVSYTAITDPTAAMAPPVAPSAPSAPSLVTSASGGVVHVEVTL
jgi:hypothetical protein